MRMGARRNLWVQGRRVLRGRWSGCVDRKTLALELVDHVIDMAAAAAAEVFIMDGAKTDATVLADAFLCRRRRGGWGIERYLHELGGCLRNG
jgi:hypothetical protein